MNTQEPTLTLLFICTHNRCRSVLCEALAKHLSQGRIAAFSAGSQPSGVVHPETLRQLQQRGINTSELRSESWDVYEDLSPDAVITVCDSAAGEQCPVWFDRSATAHWGLADPSCAERSSADQATAFDAVITTIEQRLRRLLKLDFRELETGDALRDALLHIAHEE